MDTPHKYETPAELVAYMIATYPYSVCYFYPLKQATHHDDNTDTKLKTAHAVPIRDPNTVKQQFDEVRTQYPHDELPLSSRVWVPSMHGSQWLYIPFLDMHTKNTEEGLAQLREAVQVVPDMFAHLYVYASGKSHHVYGDRLVSKQYLYKFFGAALCWRYKVGDLKMYATDVAWVGQALERETPTLRIHERVGKEKKPARPEPSLVTVLSCDT